MVNVALVIQLVKIMKVLVCLVTIVTVQSVAATTATSTATLVYPAKLLYVLVDTLSAKISNSVPKVTMIKL